MQMHPKLWVANILMPISICKILYAINDTVKANVRLSASVKNTWKIPSPAIRQKWKTCRNPAKRLSVKLKKKQNSWYRKPMHGLKTPSAPLRKHRLKKRKPARHVRN